jgi:hypothetical protein
MECSRKKLRCKEATHERSNYSPQDRNWNNRPSAWFKSTLELLLKSLRARKQPDQEIDHHEADQNSENQSEYVNTLHTREDA